MGRNRKNPNELKISRSIRMEKTLWLKIEEEQKNLKHKYMINTLEHIIQTYFNKQDKSNK